MKCPECDGPTLTIDSSDGKNGSRRRRRKCSACGARFTTREIVVSRIPIKLEKAMDIGMLVDILLSDQGQAFRLWCGLSRAKNVSANNKPCKPLPALTEVDPRRLAKLLSTSRKGDQNA